MIKKILKNAVLVTPTRIIRNDILIDGNLIAKIGKNLECKDANVIDLQGSIIFPGLIDEHVHFREPGMEHKANIRSESRAAVTGGVTSYLDMPNNSPSVTTISQINHKKDIAAKDSVANYGFYLGATDDNLEEIKNAPVKEIAGIKVFMGSSTGSLLVDKKDKLKQIFESAKTIICLHCEDTKTILDNEKRVKEQYGDNPPFAIHPIIRNRDACIESSKLAIELALETGARIHIMHISTKEEVEMLKNYVYGNVAVRQISGEACIPHLFFSECDYDRKGAFLKCNPAVKTEMDRLAISDAVENGILTTVATDHAPHETEAKTGPYFKCASGLPSVQFSLLALLELWERGEITLETIAKVTSTNVADRFHIKGRGRIEEGCFADLAVVNPSCLNTVTKNDIVSICGWSPFEGETFTCKVTHTFVNGKMIVKDGKIIDESPAMALEFDR
ncbi:MAG: dihydroorotase [Succinivibrio sp.]